MQISETDLDFLHQGIHLMQPDMEGGGRSSIVMEEARVQIKNQSMLDKGDIMTNQAKTDWTEAGKDSNHTKTSTVIRNVNSTLTSTIRITQEN